MGSEEVKDPASEVGEQSPPSSRSWYKETQVNGPDHAALSSTFSLNFDVYFDEWGEDSETTAFVLEHGPFRSRLWTRFFSPVYDTEFYSTNKDHLNIPVNCQVMLTPGKAIHVNRKWRRGVRHVTMLNHSKLSEQNILAHNRGIPQAWGWGHIRAIHRNVGGNHTDSFEVQTSMTTGRYTRISFDPANLLPGSRILPKGSPVLFQIAHVSGMNRTVKVQVSSVQYDLARFSEHLGPTPSTGLLTDVNDRFGQITVHIGGTTTGGVLSISILDLVAAFERPDSASLLDILKAARAILESRLRAADALKISIPQQDELRLALRGYENGVLPLVLLSPVLFSGRHWEFLVNNFFHQHLGGRISGLRHHHQEHRLAEGLPQQARRSLAYGPVSAGCGAKQAEDAF